MVSMHQNSVYRSLFLRHTLCDIRRYFVFTLHPSQVWVSFHIPETAKKRTLFQNYYIFEQLIRTNSWSVNISLKKIIHITKSHSTSTCASLMEPCLPDIYWCQSTSTSQDLVDLFMETTFQTECGQLLDLQLLGVTAWWWWWWCSGTPFRGERGRKSFRGYTPEV